MPWSARRLDLITPFTAVMLVLVLAACGESATVPHDTVELVPNAITGKLTDASGAPLTGRQVSVSAMSATANVVRSVATGRALEDTVSRSSVAVTDTRGVFSIPVSHAGTYGVTSLSDGDGAFATVAVSADAAGDLLQAGEVRMTSAPLGAITGQVDGPGAGIFVFALGTSFSAVTDAAGAFTMTRVPAGSYQVVAGFPGSTTAPVDVAVASGATTALSSAIAFGPRIDGVDPSGFVTPVIEHVYDICCILVSPRSFTITGSGFGSSQALSALRYADIDVDAAIRSWTDTEIVVDVERLELIGDVYASRLDYDAPAEAFVFEILTPAGSAFTDPVGIVGDSVSHWWVDATQASDSVVWIEVSTFWGHRLPDVTYALDVEGGQAFAADGVSPIDSLTTRALDPWAHHEDALIVRLGSALPAVVTLDPRATPHFGALEPTQLAVAGRVTFELDNTEIPADPEGSVELSGTALAWDGQPMPDDGDFSLTLSWWAWWDATGQHEETHPIAIDGDGRFATTVTIPEELGGSTIQVSLVYRGLNGIADAWTSVAW